MAFTSADLAAIDAAIASGATRVKYKDREVQYQTLAELLQARALIVSSLGNAGKSCTYPVHSKGV